MTYYSFSPIEKTLMGPGPSNIDPNVLKSMAKPIIGHLDPDFVALMDEIKDLLRYAFQTKNTLTFPLSGPGSVGMETCFVNLVEPGDKVIVCINGVFGHRMKENIERCGGQPIVINDEWGQEIDINKVEIALQKNPDAKILSFVHAETSTGVQSNAETLAKLAKSYNCLTIMDSVTSLAGIPIYTDKWGIDAVYSGTQKCLSCPPGLSPISFSDTAVSTVLKRRTKVQSWFMDLSLVMNYWQGNGPRAYHHTAPINAMYPLHESLLILKKEGLESSWSKHMKAHIRLRNGLESLGFTFLVRESSRLPQLNAILLPKRIVDIEANIRKRLLVDYNLEIGAGLGTLSGKIWRIGLMGYGASDKNVDICLNALKEII